MRHSEASFPYTRRRYSSQQVLNWNSCSNVATSESWKSALGEYETRTEWRCIYVWGNLDNFAQALLKGQLVSLEGKIKYRTVEEDVEGKPFKHTIAEIHASSIRRLSKVEAAADPTDGADER